MMPSASPKAQVQGQLTFEIVWLRVDQGIGEGDPGFLQVVHVHTMGMQKNIDIAMSEG